MNKRRRAIRKLIAQLCANSEQKRQDARASINALGPEDIPGLLSELERVVLNRRRLPWILGVTIVGYPLIMTACMSLLFRGEPSVGGPIGALVPMVWLFVRQFASSRDEAGRSLSAINDHRAIGPLAKAMPNVSPWIRTEVGDALIRLLPVVSEAGASAFTSSDRRALNELLLNDRKPLVISALEAVSVMGDESTVHFLQRLTNAEGVAADDLEIQDSAARCMQMLLKRAKREALQSTLVRAVDDSSNCMSLLRPSAPRADTPVQNLLHPTEGTQ